MMLKTENKNFDKDPRTGALINNNKEQFEAYKRTKRTLQSNKQMASEINSLKQDMEEIKNTLRVLLDRIQ